MLLPQMQLRHIDYFEHLKNSKFKERLSLNSPYLPKDRFSTRNSVAINLLPGSFTN